MCDNYTLKPVRFSAQKDSKTNHFQSHCKKCVCVCLPYSFFIAWITGEIDISFSQVFINHNYIKFLESCYFEKEAEHKE